MKNKINKGDWIVTKKSNNDIVILQVDFEGTLDHVSLRHALKEDFDKYPITIFSKYTAVHGRLNVTIHKDH